MQAQDRDKPVRELLKVISSYLKKIRDFLVRKVGNLNSELSNSFTTMFYRNEKSSSG